MALADNATPGHCCVCGVPTTRSLCRPCRLKWSNDGGTVPAWLKMLQDSLRLENDRRRRNSERLERGDPIKPPTGRPQEWGIILLYLGGLSSNGTTVNAVVSYTPSTEADRCRYSVRRSKRPGAI